jgi:deoxyribonuclease IV
VRFGVHVFVAKGVRHAVRSAVDRGCETVQIFSSNPRGWALSPAREDDHLRSALERAGIAPIFLHAPYLVNIAAHDPQVYSRSIACLVHAASRARALRGNVIVHAGRDRFRPREQTLEHAAAALLTTLKLVPSVRLLVEPTSGGRGSVASTLDETVELLDAIGDARVGVCFDTCHVHVAGHDLSSRRGAQAWIRAVDERIGLDRIGALHVNDARDAAGSCRDRHWHIGEGTIGDEGFAALLSDRRLRDVPRILETPGSPADDISNLERARTLARRRP